VPPRDYRSRVRDILQSIEAIRQYVAGMDFQAFCADRKTVDAVVRNIAIIGEAAGNVPAEIRDRQEEVPWQVLCDFRNVVVHRHFGIDRKIIWDTLRNDLPVLVPALRRLLEQET